jgi:hypothetical protein
MNVKRLIAVVVSAQFAIAMTASVALAGVPTGVGTPVRASYSDTSGGVPAAVIPDGVTTQYSQSLGATFFAQWMYIIQNGQQINFWGARITGVDQNSPLNDLRLRPGDVITRLDGIPVANNMYQGPNGWVMPELDRHFGSTEVRYIYHSSDYVNIGTVNLNNSGGGNTPNPVRP